MDYRDLNQVSPKDNFPLPHIDILVDNTTNFVLFSFMNGFSCYNQIQMAPEDMEKDNLHHPMGNFMLQGDVLWAQEHWGNLPTDYGGAIPRHDA